MVDKEIKEAQELSEEQLENVSGGARVLRANSNEAEGNDSVLIGILESSALEEENDGHRWDPGLRACNEGDDGLSRILRMRSN